MNTSVNYDGQTHTINGGTISGQNIFHSFSEFSLPTGQIAFFNNPQTVNNIISRVTGTSKSSIDGLIRANCCANLFFINPNGIIFGPNASLDIGGSFFGSTASEIIFSDGHIFSATNPQSDELLSVNIPQGLNFRGNSGEIQVNGIGHNATVSPNGNSFVPYNVPITSGLQVKPGQTLALVGGAVNLNGGILSAPSGNVSLGSVNTGIVTLNSTLQGWELDYDKVNSFQNIQLSQKSLVDASGSGDGFIHVQGANITLTDGSLLHIQHYGTQSRNSIVLKATDSINLIGSTPSKDRLIPSAVLVENIGDGDSGDISISAKNLFLKQGGTINSATFGGGKGSNININILDSVQLIDSLGTDDQTLISTQTNGSGAAGNLYLSTKYLNLLNGGAIGSITYDDGNSGDVTIKASDSVELSGSIIPTPFLVTTISSITFGSGNSGNLTIDTKRLKILNGAIVTTSTFSKGNAGTLTVNASDSVLLDGVSTDLFDQSDPTSFARSVLASSAQFAPQFGFTEPPTGQTGNLIINTSKLSITNGAVVNIGHGGTGNAGDLKVNAGFVFLDKGRIIAETKSGLGGNININAEDGILIRNGSFISANAKGTGDGGNIKINTPFLVAFPNENSDIIANSLIASGGRVDITAKAIFGFTPRSREELQQLLGTTDPAQLDPRFLLSSDITAISQSNPSLNGQVTLNTPDVDPSKGLIELPTTVVDPDALVAQNPCKRGSESEFTRSGRGGLPASPAQNLSDDTTQVSLVEPASVQNRSTVKTQSQAPATQTSINLPQPPEKQIAPAQGWVYNEKGDVVLVAYNPTVISPQRIKENAACPVQ